MNVYVSMDANKNTKKRNHTNAKLESSNVQKKKRKIKLVIGKNKQNESDQKITNTIKKLQKNISQIMLHINLFLQAVPTKTKKKQNNI